MEAQLSESSVFPSQSYAASFFTKFPSDSRFLKVAHQRFMPLRIIDGKDIEFSLDRYSAGNVILIQDTTLSVRIQILKADGKSLPDTDKFVAPRNNILHTLFSSVALHINNIQITTAPDNYCYKAYMSNLMSYSSSAKSTHLQLQGYADDTEAFMDSADPEVNTGFGNRNNLFRIGFDSQNPYRPEGAQFIGRLYHELSSCETGLPPNTKVRFVLTKNKDSFILQSAETDPEQYQVKITNIFLTVPIAQLSQSVFDELSYLMSKKEDAKPVTIQFRKFEVVALSVPKFKQDYQTGDLFTDGDLPCRIVIAFVDAKARLGSNTKNPYRFQRKWEYDVAEQSTFSVEQRIIYLEALVQKLSKKQPELTSEESALQGTSQGVDTTPMEIPTSGPSTSSVTEPSTSAFASAVAAGIVPPNIRDLNLDQLFEHLKERMNLQIVKMLEEKLPKSLLLKYQKDTYPAPSKSSVWITNMKVTLNNSLIDQIDDTQTEDECLNSYYRLCQTTGVLNSPFNNGITYEQFRQGYFLSCYDFSTSGKCGTNYVIPTIRSGHLRIEVHFSLPLSVDLTMLMLCEYTGTLAINKNTTTSTSYKAQ